MTTVSWRYTRDIGSRGRRSLCTPFQRRADAVIGLSCARESAGLPPPCSAAPPVPDPAVCEVSVGEAGSLRSRQASACPAPGTASSDVEAEGPQLVAAVVGDLV